MSSALSSLALWQSLGFNKSCSRAPRQRAHRLLASQALPASWELSSERRKSSLTEEIAVSAHGAQMRGFTLPTARSVQVVAEGKTNADKGFDVFVISSSELENFEKGQSFKQVGL
jgi:hypothetical protein